MLIDIELVRRLSPNNKYKADFLPCRRVDEPMSVPSILITCYGNSGTYQMIATDGDRWYTVHYGSMLFYDPDDKALKPVLVIHNGRIPNRAVAVLGDRIRQYLESGDFDDAIPDNVWE